MTPDPRYEITIYWSAEDAAFLAEVPDLPGCMAHGDTYEEALAQALSAIEAWIETALEIGHEVPAPRTRPHAEHG
jgi:predicted RNase H-like HicB family nuclease